MPYKTRYREIELPENDRQLEPLLRDANSLRSLGGATYREMAPGFKQYGHDKMLQVFLAFAGKLENPAKTVWKERYPPGARRKLRYFMQGFQTAAQDGGDRTAYETIRWAFDRDNREWHAIDGWI